MLFARKALFLRGRNQIPVQQQGRRTIVIVAEIPSIELVMQFLICKASSDYLLEMPLIPSPDRKYLVTRKSTSAQAMFTPVPATHHPSMSWNEPA